MQNIEKILKIDGSAATWADKWGKTLAAPELMVGVKYCLVLDLRSVNADAESGELLPVAPDEFDADSFYIALDADYDQTTIPKLLKTDGITLSSSDDGRVLLAVELPETALPELIAALDKSGSVSLHGEIGGFEVNDGAAAAGFAFQFELTVRNRIWLGGEVPPEVEGNPEYLTAAEVRALIAEATRPPKGDKGDPGLSAYEIAVAGGYTGTQAEWLESLKGKDGEDGASAYELAVAGGYEGTESEWLESLKGEAGLSAYEVAVLQGYMGTAEEWLASLKGEPGDGLHYDKSGELSELDAYADEPAGFVFAATETDSETKTSKLYLYTKNSDDFGDWCDPLVLTFFERKYKITTLAPVKFSAPTGANVECLTFNVSDYPNATVAAVTIDTAEGELTLPYGSALGIRKIVKNSGKLLIYFGAQCPEYETGKIYLSQFLGMADSADPDIPAETATVFYGCISDGVTYQVSQITAEKLAADSVISGPVPADAVTIDAPAGAVVFALVPAGFTVSKDDGLGGRVPFELDNGTAGTGANGQKLTINGTEYLAFGEFNLIAGETIIYIDREA